MAWRGTKPSLTRSTQHQNFLTFSTLLDSLLVSPSLSFARTIIHVTNWYPLKYPFFFPNLPPYNLPWLKHLHPSYISLFGHQHTKEYILCWVATYNSIYVLLMLYCWVATINYIYFILYVFVPFICFVNRSSSILKILF